MGWKKRACAALTAALCLFSGCGVPSLITGEERPVDNVRVSTDYFGMAWYQNGTLNPVLDGTAVNRLLSEALYEGLFEVSSGFTAQNVLCESYEGDGSTFTFTLREGVQFWSGETLTAIDVAESLNTARYNEDSPYYNRLTEVTAIEVIDNLTLRIRLSSPNTAFPRLLDIPVFRNGSALSGDFADGTGPFQPVKEESGWMLRAFENWNGGFLGSIRNITLIPVARADAIDSSFRTGDVSILRQARIAPDANSTLHGGSVDAVPTATADMHYLGINHDRRNLSNAKVRQALSIAIGRQSLCDTQLQTFAIPAVLPVNPQPADDAPSVSADIERAIRLLREGVEEVRMGISDNSGDEDDEDTDSDEDTDENSDENTDEDTDENTDEDSDENTDENTDETGEDTDEYTDEGDSSSGDTDESGEDTRSTEPPEEMISLRLLVNSDNTFKVAAAEQIAASWKAIGVGVILDAQPYETYLERVEAGEFDVYYGETLLTADFDMRPLISAGGSLNYGGYADEEMSAAVAAARRGDDVAGYYSTFLEKMPVIPLAFERGQIIIRKGLIDNFTPAPYNAFAGQEQWTTTG